MPTIELIVAYSTNRCIGKANTLPWHLPEDLGHFKRTTLNKPIIMGRNTFESIGKALPGRRNIVITRNSAWQPAEQQLEIFYSLPQALEACAAEPLVFIIGGAELFETALPLASKVIATEIEMHIDGDRFFPVLAPDAWHKTVRQASTSSGSGIQYQIIDYERINTL